MDANNLSTLLENTIKAERVIRENRNIIEQPTMEGIVHILKHVVITQADEGISVGDRVNMSIIEELFGRSPRQEGINFCHNTKKLFLITKIGSDNPTVKYAEYNDYWKLGKIYYEGKGHGDYQKMNGSNLHLYRKYQVFHGLISCKKGVEPHVHVLNKIDDGKSEFQYLGQFYVSDFYVNEHSIENNTKTKMAILYELTPICGKRSKDIDTNYDL